MNAKHPQCKDLSVHMDEGKQNLRAANSSEKSPVDRLRPETNMRTAAYTVSELPQITTCE